MSCQLNKSAGETATHVQRFRTKTDALREGWQDFLMDRTYPNGNALPMFWLWWACKMAIRG